MGTSHQILVTGGTGTLGQAILARLQGTKCQVRATSRSPPPTENIEWVRMGLKDGTGIREAISDSDIVIHTATSPRANTEAIDVDGTIRLIDAAADAEVSNFVYPSIVGIEELPYSYYKHKLTAEHAIEASDVPATLLRTTQFFPLIDEMLGMISRLPIWPIPSRKNLQPIDIGVVADHILEHATLSPHGRIEPIGGPEIRTAGELARE